MARGTFKQKRGGGRNFSKNLVLDENGTAVATDKWAHRGRRNGGEESEEESEEEDAAAPATSATQPELTRAERRELKKKKAQGKQQQAAEDGEEEDDNDDPLLANPNTTAVRNVNGTANETHSEQKEKKEAQERYWKLHAQGKTDQAKADLARLAKIRAEREAAQAKRKAEAEGTTARRSIS
ncbi:casein kinase substrate phosphoprotein PP28-domain-containing protein [Trametes polyzona]|nr:casein kinase substrate phosphoprotein PP28-domain-containing protein [Trametes polyzona]